MDWVVSYLFFSHVVVKVVFDIGFLSSRLVFNGCSLPTSH